MNERKNVNFQFVIYLKRRDIQKQKKEEKEKKTVKHLPIEFRIAVNMDEKLKYSLLRDSDDDVSIWTR